MSNSKTCTDCGQIFVATSEFFHRDKSRADGLHNICKGCAKAKRHERYLKNRERAIAYSSQWASENYQRVLAKNRAWRVKNPERVKHYECNWKKNHRDVYLAGRRRRYLANSPRNREYSREWRKANPDKVRLHWKTRQARKRSSGGNHTPEDIRRQFQIQRGLCWWCGKSLEEKWAVDHRIPLAKGGSNDARNIVIAHIECNQAKKDKMPWEYNGRLL